MFIIHVNILKQEAQEFICLFHLKEFFNAISESIALMFMNDN